MHIDKGKSLIRIIIKYYYIMNHGKMGDKNEIILDREIRFPIK